MADMEDDAEFGSHFLDSMLEVEMTEDDNELDVSKTDDPQSLPPIPTFDLQSETLTYKDAYRNPITQPVMGTIPTQSKNPPSVSMVMKPSSMLVYRGDAPPIKTGTVINTGKRIPKPNPKVFPTQTLNPLRNVNNTSSLPSTIPLPPPMDFTRNKFIDEVFKPEFVRNVFVKADPPADLETVTEEELKYYKTCFKDVSKVKDCRLHCTICDKHLGCSIGVEKKINVHSMLKVLTCKPCFEFYGDGNFPCDKGDNCEIYCRWCGQGGALVCCSFCPRVFCKKCVRRNYGPNFLRKIERATDWACFCCAQKPLWPHRAVCRALLEFLQMKKTEPKANFRDLSSCCKAATMGRRRVNELQEKNKIVIPTDQQPVKIGPGASLSIVKNKNLPQMKSKNGQLRVKPLVRLKSEKEKPQGETRGGSVGSIFSPKSIFEGNKIIRGVARAPAKLFSSFPSPQLIQSPVLHGETLITPPTRYLVQPNPPPAPPATSTPVLDPPYVKVTLTNQAPEWDFTQVPTVKIPQSVQGLVLRLVFPDNKVQYIRLVSDGNPAKDFPMPVFKEHGGCFVEENLAEAFQVTKSLYEKLMRVRDKVNARTKLTEESTFNSAVKKLHSAYENAMELFKDLDASLVEHHEEWQKAPKGTVDVIDISDDETSPEKKKPPSRYTKLREKCKKLSDDSEVEIIEDVVVNGTATPSFRCRTSNERERTPSTRGKKRRRGKIKSRRAKVTKLQNGEPEKDPLGVEEKNPDEFNLEEDTLVDAPESEEKLENEVTKSVKDDEEEEEEREGTDEMEGNDENDVQEVGNNERYEKMEGSQNREEENSSREVDMEGNYEREPENAERYEEGNHTRDEENEFREDQTCSTEQEMKGNDREDENDVQKVENNEKMERDDEIDVKEEQNNSRDDEITGNDVKEEENNGREEEVKGNSGGQEKVEAETEGNYKRKEVDRRIEEDYSRPEEMKGYYERQERIEESKSGEEGMVGNYFSQAGTAEDYRRQERTEGYYDREGGRIEGQYSKETNDCGKEEVEMPNYTENS